jgi:hemerythrin-like domain-containing protein
LRASHRHRSRSQAPREALETGPAACYHLVVIGIGTRQRAGAGGGQGDAVDALLECHERIRQMSGLAGAIAAAQDRPDAEVREAAGRVRRYFSGSLAQHVEDEEQSLLPRLRGRDASIDAALARMETEHGEHEALVARLVAACTELERDPAALPVLRAELAEVSARLAGDFASHLDSEEQIVFPAVRQLLSADERDQIRAEMRARRAPPR